jgi:hypothetical protein
VAILCGLKTVHLNEKEREKEREREREREYGLTTYREKAIIGI